MYADSAPPSLIDPITSCVFCKPVVSPSTGRTYSEKTVIDFGMKDPYSMKTIDMLIPNRDKQEELDKFYLDKFKETVDNVNAKSIDQNVDEIVELVAVVVDRSDLQVCLNGQRLLIELIQSSTNDQLGRFKAKLDLRGLGMVAKLVEKQNATILKGRLGIDVSSLADAMLLPSQPVPPLSFPPVSYTTSTASIHGSDDEEEYDFSDTESVTSSVSCADDKTYVFVGRMPPKTTVKGVKEHFVKFKDSIIGRVWFIKGSNGTKARLTFKTSESAFVAIELMNRSFFPNSSTPILVKMWEDKRKKSEFKQSSPHKKNAPESLVGEPVATADVYVGNNLPPSVTENDIRKHFKMFEPHIQKLVLITVKDPKTKRSRRFAKVTFVSLQAAQMAVEKLHNTQLPQSKYRLVINVWKSKKDTDEVPTSPTKSIPEEDAGSLVGEPVAATDVYVGNNLPPSVTENDIKMHFRKFEPHIQKVILIKDSKTKQSKGFAKVTFISLQAAQMAVEKLHNTQLPQSKQRLVVNIWKPKKETDEVPTSLTKFIPDEDAKGTEKKSRQKRKQKGTSEQVAMALDLEDEPKEELVGLTIENVSVQISGDQLKLMLESFGDVKRYSITSAPTGKTVYKAEVYFSSREEADDTISHLNGNQLAGEKISVQYISKSTKKTSVETFGVFVGNIPKVLHKPEFQQIFAKYGKISSIFLNSEKNFGYVNYFSLEDANAALDMNNRDVHGSKLRVNSASKKTTETSAEPNLSDSLSIPAPTTVPESTNFLAIPIVPKESSPKKSASFTVQIRNLSPRTTQEQLTKLVECYGSLTCPVHLIKGDPPYAYVNYATSEAANAACSYLHDQQLDGKTIRVKLKEDKDAATPVSPSVPLTTSAVPPFITTATPQSYPPAIPNIPIQPHIPPPIASVPQYPLPSTVRLRRASAQFNRFLHERMDLKLREFASFGGSVRWNNDFLTVEAPSEAALNRFEMDVLNVLDEEKVVLCSEDWNKLMLMRPDKTSLFQQLMLPYRTNPNVYIESHDAALTICIVGMRDAVKDVKITIMSELNKEITVEE